MAKSSARFLTSVSGIPGSDRAAARNHPLERSLRRRERRLGSNENKMSDGGRGRASLGVEGWKSSQKWSVQRSAVRSIAWLGDVRCIQDLPTENSQHLMHWMTETVNATLNPRRKLNLENVMCEQLE